MTGFPGQWNHPVANGSSSALIPTDASTASASGVRPSTGIGSSSASHGVVVTSSSNACMIESMSHATCSASRSAGGVSSPSSMPAWLGCCSTCATPSTTSVGTGGDPSASQRSRCSLITTDSNSTSCAPRNSLVRPQTGQPGWE